jgi:hypothetical protein
MAFDVELDTVVVSVPLADETNEALALVEDDTVPAGEDRLLDEEADEDGEADEDEDEEDGINFAPEM